MNQEFKLYPNLVIQPYKFDTNQLDRKMLFKACSEGAVPTEAEDEQIYDNEDDQLTKAQKEQQKRDDKSKDDYQDR